jgi:hypothetical protein
MTHTTDPGARAAFTASLRKLADYLDKHPSIPVPKYGADISLIVDDTDDGGREQIAQIARAMHTKVNSRREGNVTTSRSFGEVRYAATSISPQVMARHDTVMSYWDSVLPDAKASADA